MKRENKRLKVRNKDIRNRFNELSKKYQHWKYEALIEKLANEFYLSNRTIQAIINSEGIYNEL
ncbi:hypothetical protein [Tenacibaculum maritimum]|uniref:hypothetical protein n=1 Tax=Tenacibaculum maritimum TaxID=107401 RepID=UPI0038770CE1